MGLTVSLIEIKLSQHNMSIQCTAKMQELEMNMGNMTALSMRGAQREITGWLLKVGYVPASRWTQYTTDTAIETTRYFRK